MTGVLTREKTQRNETKTQRRQSRGRLEQRLELHSPSQGMPRVIRSWKGKEGGFLQQTLQAAQPYQYLNFRLLASRTTRGYFLLF